MLHIAHSKGSAEPHHCSKRQYASPVHKGSAHTHTHTLLRFFNGHSRLHPTPLLPECCEGRWSHESVSSPPHFHWVPLCPSESRVGAVPVLPSVLQLELSSKVVIMGYPRLWDGAMIQFSLLPACQWELSPRHHHTVCLWCSWIKQWLSQPTVLWVKCNFCCSEKSLYKNPTLPFLSPCLFPVLLLTDQAGSVLWCLLNSYQYSNFAITYNRSCTQGPVSHPVAKEKQDQPSRITNDIHRTKQLDNMKLKSKSAPYDSYTSGN